MTKSKVKPMKVSRRIVSVKRHTIGYVVGGRSVTVAEATQLAAQGRLNNVIKVGSHIQSRPGAKRLADLATTIRR